jgi:hypothetical protein
LTHPSLFLKGHQQKSFIQKVTKETRVRKVFYAASVN